MHADPDPEADKRGIGYTPGFVHQVIFETYLKEHDNPEDIEYYMCGPGPMSNAHPDGISVLSSRNRATASGTIVIPKSSFIKIKRANSGHIRSPPFSSVPRKWGLITKRMFILLLQGAVTRQNHQNEYSNGDSVGMNLPEIRWLYMRKHAHASRAA